MAAWEGKRARISEKKLTAQCPRWLRLNDDRTEFEFVPERAALVIEILAWHKAGMGQALIAKRLNERNEQPFSNHGNGWHSSYIQKIINSPALYGEFQPALWNKGASAPHGDPIADYYPALISKEEFNLLKYLRSERSWPGARARKGTEVPNLLSGVAKCGYCGSTMILAGSSAKRVRSEDGAEVRRPAKKVLVCDGARRGLGCYAVQWDYAAFETSFLSFCKSLDLINLLESSDRLALEQKRELTVGELLGSTNTAIASCNQRLERLLAALETGEVSAAVVNRIKKVEQERDLLLERRELLESELKALAVTGRHLAYQAEAVQHAIQRLNSMSDDERFSTRSMLAEHIRHLIQSVDIHPAGTLVTPDFIERRRISLLAEGFDEHRVESYLATAFRTEPLRTGRGVRGRYASREDVGRFFVIKARKGGLRIVYPDFNVPSEVRINLGNE
nr:recombinase family protein [Duganella aquatilis]